MEKVLSCICYPNVEYSLPDFLMDTKKIMMDTETRSSEYPVRKTVQQPQLRSWG